MSTNGATHSGGIVHIVDGGFLQYKVIWQRNKTVEESINKCFALCTKILRSNAATSFLKDTLQLKNRYCDNSTSN